MLCTVVDIRYHDRGCELHLQPGDRVRIEGDPWSHSRPWTMLSRLERV